MSRSLNKVELIGHLTRDPQVSYTSNGSVNAKFSIATNRVIKKADGTNSEVAEFFEIEAWGKLAEICNQLLKKGSYVYVDGELRNQSWTDQSGNNKTKTVIRINSMISLSTKREGGAPAAGSTSNGTETDEELPIVEEIDESIDDMPF